MNDLYELHKSANDALLGRLHSGLLGLRSSTGDYSPSAEALAERASIPIDTAQVADTGRDFGGDQSKGVKA